MGVLQYSAEITRAFPEKNLGFITVCVEPVSAGISLNTAMDYFNEDEMITSLPVEKDGGVIGLLSKDTVMAKSRSAWEQIMHRSLDAFITEDTRSFDSRENCEKVAALMTEDEHKTDFNDLLIFHRGSYLGILPIRRLMHHVADLRHRELNYARDLQEFLINRGSIACRGFYYETLLRMSHELGGDFHQAVQLDEDSALLCCFDVSGKNVAASLCTSIISSFFATLEIQGELNRLDPNELCRSLNNVLAATTPMDVFVVGIFFFIDTRSNKVKMMNFGYSPVYVISIESGKGKIAVAEPKLPPLGIEEMESSEELTEKGLELSIRTNLKLICYSDGLTDIEDPMGRHFGQDQVDSFIKDHYSLDAREFVRQLDTAISEYQKSAPQTDDITVQVLQF